MSDQDLDKLFRSKLEDIKKDPSPKAWEQISEALPQKRKGALFFRIAAAILLLMTAGSVIWYIGQGSVEPTIAENSISTTPPEASGLKNDSSMVEEKTYVEPQNNTASDEVPEVKEQKNTKQEESNTAPLLANKPHIPQRMEHEAPESQPDPVETETFIAQTVPEKTPMDEEPEETTFSGQTISFNIDEFASAETKMIAAETTTESLPDADDQGLKKFWNVLRKVKEPEAGIGELREIKNNILAFGKEKDETE